MPTAPAPLHRGHVPFARTLASHGDRVALVTGDGAVTYRQLAARVDDAVRRLGAGRRLVLLAMANELDAVVAYLAALSAGHPVLLAPGDNPAALAALRTAYDPDVVVSAGSVGWDVEEARPGTAHRLHPDLALLLSTSGSTGSPKLVRLSTENVQANAEAIAGYLPIRDTDRAVTTLPLHYCYGLSVLNSHLLRGAAVVLTNLSVVDPCFWDLFRRTRATTFAGVPYTFELLDRVGFAEMDLPHLRYVTQAGGRLAPERVRRFAELGRRAGWDLFVMYGQTEATARMAYLPPDLALRAPHAIGVPVPGGSFALEPVPDVRDPDIGELVYAGPNVMLGYATTPPDLELGRTVEVLRTGDLARRDADGLYEVVGRRSRFVKVLGQRIDLDRAEAMLAGHGLTTCCVGTDDELVVAAVDPGQRGVEDTAGDAVRRLAARELGVPRGAVRVLTLTDLPLLPSGKPDAQAVAGLARAATPPSSQPTAAFPDQFRDQSPGRHSSGEPPAESTPRVVDAAILRALYAELLDRSDVTNDSTFVGLGGDSLSYVEVSVRLEELLGHLPAGWHTTPIRDLSPRDRRRRWAPRAVETSVLLRAVAIVLVVGTHAHLFTLPGTAHVLLAVAGFNFARFQLSGGTRQDRLRRRLGAVARIAVPSVAWIGAVVLLSGDYGLANVLLLEAVVGPQGWGPDRHFWFVEVLVYLLLAVAVLLAVPWADRAQRRYPFGFAAALLGAGLVTRFGLVDLGVPSTRPALWLFALGWAAALSTTLARRVLLTVAAVAAVPGFFGDPQREAILLTGLLLLVWVRALPCPAGLNRVAGVLASASLYVYLTHWQVFPLLWEQSTLAAALASLAAGVLYWQLVTRVAPGAARRLTRWRPTPARRRPVCT